MDGQDEQTSKRFSFRDSAGSAWNVSYRFVQPKLRRLVRPAVYAGLGAAAYFGVQNRSDVKGAVRPETPTVKGTLISIPDVKNPEDLGEQIIVLDGKTEEHLLPATKAKIQLCDDTETNGKLCRELTIYYTEDDLSGKKVEVEGSNITVQEPFLGESQTRPWTRVRKEN